MNRQKSEKQISKKAKSQKPPQSKSIQTNTSFVSMVKNSFSENKPLYQLLNNLWDGVYHSTPQGRFIFANKALATMLGYADVEELLQIDIPTQLYFDTEERTAIQEISRNKPLELLVFRLKKKDGSELWVEERARVHVNENGEIVYYEGVLRDITEKLKVEAALQKSEERYRQLVERVPDGIYHSTERGKFLTVNSALVRMLGYKSHADLLRIDISKDLYFDPGDRKRATELLSKRQKEPTIARLKKKDGSEIWVEEHGLEVFNAEDNTLHYEGVLRDITERKWNEDALHSVVNATSPLTGDDFFRSLTKQLSSALKVPYALISECVETGKTQMRSLSFWANGRFVKNFEYDVQGTPCEEVVKGKESYCPQDFRKRLPKDFVLLKFEINSHLAVPCFSVSGEVNGYLAVMGTKRLRNVKNTNFILKIFAARAAAEIERKQHEQDKLRKFELLQTIYQLNYVVSQAADVKKVFDEALYAIGKALNVEGSAIFLLDGQKMQLRASQNLSNRFLASMHNLPPFECCLNAEGPLLVPVIEASRFFDDKEHLADFNIALRRENFKALACLPLTNGGLLIGRFMLFYRSEHDFTEEEAQLAQTIAGHVASAVGRIQADTALRASQERFKDLFENAPDMYFLFQPGGKIIKVNRKALDTLGYSKVWLLGKNFTDLIYHDDVENSLVIIHDILQEKHIRQNTEVHFVSQDGSKILCSNQFSVVRNSAGKIELIQVACRDITENRKLHEELARSHRLETAGRVAGQIAHDFNNLLAPLTAYPSLIREDLKVKRDVSMLLNEMESASQKIAEINQQLLALGRRGHYNMEVLNVNDLIDKLLRARFWPKEVVIAKELEPGLKSIMGGGAQLTRALSNLINNANEAMNGIGKVIVRTTSVRLARPLQNCQTVPPGEYVNLSIIDEGPGIDPECLDHIFEPFFTTKTMDKKQGSGLGLSIVHGVVEDHNGYITVDSEIGRGTTFSLYFPTTSKTVIRGKAPLLKSQNGHESILVVDDDPVQRRVITELLSRLGYQVQAADSGERAVSLAMKGNYDLVVLDMVMSGIDGAETYRQILDAKPSQRAIIMSGFAMSQRVEEALSLGAYTFVAKPVQFHDLATAVRNSLDTTAVSQNE